MTSGKTAPENLIKIPPVSKVNSVAGVWSVWNGMLRRGKGLDKWHQGLIDLKGFGFNSKGTSADYTGWANKWIAQYRYFRVIGEEIERRLNIGGHTLKEIIDRLEVIRWTEMFGRFTVQALVDGIRIAQGKKPFNSKEGRADPDIKDLLDEENY
jgi:hypothetical protein